MAPIIVYMISQFERFGVTATASATATAASSPSSSTSSSSSSNFKRSTIKCDGVTNRHPNKVVEIYINDNEREEEMLSLQHGSFFTATLVVEAERSVSINRSSKVSD